MAPRWRCRTGAVSIAFFGDGSFEVGGYRISKIERDSTSTSQFSIGPYREKRSKTGFRFVFSGEAASWQVQCSKQFNGHVRHDVIPVPMEFRVDGQNGNLAALELRQPGKVCGP